MPGKRIVVAVLIAAWGQARAGELVVPEKYRPILALAGGAPSEFAADAILRVVETGRIEDKASRAALIEQAFAAAAGARETVMRRVVQGSGIDTEAGMRDGGYRLRLDAMSLQSRAVGLMLKLDPVRARAMFGEMARPALAPLSCRDALVYDISAYYGALAGVLDKSFSGPERAREDHVNFALNSLAGMASPVELGPGLRMLRAVSSFTAPQRELLESRLGAVMEAMPPDDRSFEAARQEIDAALPSVLRDEWLKFGRRMAAGETCGVPAGSGAALVAPAQGTSKDTMPDTGPLWATNEAKAMLASARAIRFPGGAAFPSGGAAGEEDFVERFTAMLNDLGAWQQPEGEDAAAYYHEKCTLYEGLVDVAPAGAPRRRLIEDFAAFAASSSLQRDRTGEWFLHVQGMIHRVPFSGDAEKEQALETLARTGNPAMTLYAAIERLIPHSPGGQN